MNIDRPKPYRQIPKEAKSVFKGIIHDVYQWQQKMFDGTFETFEMLRRVDTVNIIPVTKDGKIIVTNQQQPGVPEFFGLVGGRVDRDEDPELAALRELLEETGYQPEKLELWFAIQPTGLIDWSVFTFIARGCEKIAEQKLDSGEKIDLEFLTFDEFTNKVAEEGFRDKEVQQKFARILLDEKETENLRKLLS